MPIYLFIFSGSHSQMWGFLFGFFLASVNGVNRISEKVPLFYSNPVAELHIIAFAFRVVPF